MPRINKPGLLQVAIYAYDQVNIDQYQIKYVDVFSIERVPHWFVEKYKIGNTSGLDYHSLESSSYYRSKNDWVKIFKEEGVKSKLFN